MLVGYSGKITAGFIITGPNIASQDLLFEQLAERLSTATETHPKFVRLRASEAPNLKAVLKKIIRDASAVGLGDEEDVDVEVTQGVSLTCVLRHRWWSLKLTRGRCKG